MLVASATVSASVSAGVKPGDWIEYDVVYSGNAPEGHNYPWYRMEVVTVEGPVIVVRIMSRDANGVMHGNSTYTLNLETGHLIDEFIIPANLNVGDTFFDETYGNVTISGVQERIVAGAKRTIIQGEVPSNTYYWDQATGVTVEGHASYQDIDFTMDTIIRETNMWQPQQQFILDSTVVYTLIAAIVVVGITATLVVVRRKKRAA